MESTNFNQPHSAFGKGRILGESVLFSGLEQDLLYNLAFGLFLIALPLIYTKLSGPIISAVSVFSAFFSTLSSPTAAIFPKQNREWFETGSRAKSLLFRLWAKDEGLKLGFRQ